ncbi:MAG: carboxypeptidase-like regulatory domain-containing protein [Bacteroidota bacterium]|nr:carboxypeptidase-like regulatory domain-containing protein [Bacteroidota bacterium]
MKVLYTECSYRLGGFLILMSILFLAIQVPVFGQQDPALVQISGLVVTENEGEPVPLPFTEISILGTPRGCYADHRGFFSLAVQRSDTLVFNYIGYKTIYYVVPANLDKDRYTLFQIMTRDNILLPETIIYPWPSKEYFKQDFLQMDVSDKLRDIAQQNVAQETIRRLMQSTPADARESASLYLSQQAQKAYYNGQFQPMRILSPGAWIEFFKAWKRGDFKRKK